MSRADEILINWLDARRKVHDLEHETVVAQESLDKAHAVATHWIPLDGGAARLQVRSFRDVQFAAIAHNGKYGERVTSIAVGETPIPFYRYLGMGDFDPGISLDIDLGGGLKVSYAPYLGAFWRPGDPQGEIRAQYDALLALSRFEPGIPVNIGPGLIEDYDIDSLFDWLKEQV